MTSVPFAASEDSPKPDPLQRLLRLANAKPHQAICVAGPDSLEVMSALCRAGFDRVECVRQATSAEADETGDLLILAGPPEALGGLCARTAPLLRNGGVVAARLERREDDAAIRTALLVHGLEIATSCLDIAGGLIAAHRIWRAPRLARAAS